MKVVLFANTEWYLYNFRRSLAQSLQRAGHQLTLISPPGPYGPKLQQQGFRWVEAPMVRRSLNPLRELMLLIWLIRLLRTEGVDLIHGFTIKCAVYGAIAGRIAGTSARFSSVAGMGYVFTSFAMKARFLRPLVKLIMRFAFAGQTSRLIVQNSDDLSFFKQLLALNSDQLRLIRGSGVDSERFIPKQRISKSATFGTFNAAGCFRVLLPARLLWDKGIAEFVEAARIVGAQNQSLEFLLAGEPDIGNPNAVPINTLKGWVDQGLIKWLGHVDDMAELLNSVDLVALPTSYGEGVPKSLIEAAACGLPLIATDVPGCREVITNGVDGLLVPVKNADALAEAILRLSRDSELCRRLGSAAREKVLREFDEQIVVNQTLLVYREILPGI